MELKVSLEGNQWIREVSPSHFLDIALLTKSLTLTDQYFRKLLLVSPKRRGAQLQRVYLPVCVRLELKWIHQHSHSISFPPFHSLSGFMKVELGSSGASVSLGRAEHLQMVLKACTRWPPPSIFNERSPQKYDPCFLFDPLWKWTWISNTDQTVVLVKIKYL